MLSALFQTFHISKIQANILIILIVIASVNRSFANVGSLRIVLKDFDLRGTVPDSQLDSFYERLKDKLNESTKCMIIAGKELDRILDENNIVKENCSELECLSKIGKLSKAPIVISGLIIALQDSYYIEVSLINAIDSKILSTESFEVLIPKFEADAGVKVVKIVSSSIERNFPKTKVSILSEPSGAVVSLNDNIIGKTPLDIEYLRQVIVYELKMEKQGFKSYEESVQFRKSRDKVSIVLTPTTGTLDITGRPPGSKVFINDSYIGKLPNVTYQDLEGSYDILVRKKGYREYRQKIYISSKDTRYLNVILRQKSKIPAMLSSAIIPGSGQIVRGHPFKGILFFTATIGIGYFAYHEHLAYEQQYKTYRSDLDRFNHQADLNLIENNRERVWDSFNQMKDKEKIRNDILCILGAVWTINVFEIALD